MYGHLVVMAIVNITIPFLLITWAEQSVDSSLAAILTSPVPLFAIILSALFLADEPISRVDGVAGLIVGFIGVIIITSPGLTSGNSSIAGELALLGAAFSYAVGAVYSRRNVRGLPPMIAAVFQVSFAAIFVSVFALLFEHPWTATPDAEADRRDRVARHLRVRARLSARVPAVLELGRDPNDAHRLRLPPVGIVLGVLVLNEAIDARIVLGTGLVVAGVGLVNGKFGRRRLFGRVPPIEAV